MSVRAETSAAQHDRSSRCSLSTSPPSPARAKIRPGSQREWIELLKLIPFLLQHAPKSLIILLNITTIRYYLKHGALLMMLLLLFLSFSYILSLKPFSSCLSHTAPDPMAPPNGGPTEQGCYVALSG